MSSAIDRVRARRAEEISGAIAASSQRLATRVPMSHSSIDDVYYLLQRVAQAMNVSTSKAVGPNRAAQVASHLLGAMLGADASMYQRGWDDCATGALNPNLVGNSDYANGYKAAYQQNQNPYQGRSIAYERDGTL